jgi:hypothetical protein
MLMIEPPPFRSMPGRNALIVRCIDLMLRSMKQIPIHDQCNLAPLPWWTYHCNVGEYVQAPNFFLDHLAKALTSRIERTSSLPFGSFEISELWIKVRGERLRPSAARLPL